MMSIGTVLARNQSDHSDADAPRVDSLQLGMVTTPALLEERKSNASRWSGALGHVNAVGDDLFEIGDIEGFFQPDVVDLAQILPGPWRESPPGNEDELRGQPWICFG